MSIHAGASVISAHLEGLFEQFLVQPTRCTSKGFGANVTTFGTNFADEPEIALYRTLGRLPESDATHRFC